MPRIDRVEIGDKVKAEKFVWDRYYFIEGTVVDVEPDTIKIKDVDGRVDYYDSRPHSTTVYIHVIERGNPATARQLQYLADLNAHHGHDLTKREASQLINDAKTEIIDPTLYFTKPINAICERCGEVSPVEEMVDGRGGYDWDNPNDDLAGSVYLLSYRCADGVRCQTNRVAQTEATKILAEVEHYGRYDDNSPGQIGGGL